MAITFASLKAEFGSAAALAEKVREIEFVRCGENVSQSYFALLNVALDSPGAVREVICNEAALDEFYRAVTGIDDEPRRRVLAEVLRQAERAVFDFYMCS